MSKLEELIQELCPDGVEYKKIGECFNSFNGMTGVSLKWKEEGNCRFIDYLNVYNNLKVDVSLTPFATVKSMDQNTLKQGDILVTTASEVPDECAIASVIEDNIEENIFLDDHLFGLRLNDKYKNMINTTFIAYYMHTREYRLNVRKKVKGVTRFFVSPNDIEKITIPVPPLEVQQEIVRILDSFTELTTELTARKQQYEYYRDNCINKCASYKKLPLSDLVISLKTGLNPRRNFSLNEAGSIYPYVTGKNIYDNAIHMPESIDKITPDALKLINKRAELEKGLLLFASTGTGTVGRMALIREYNNDWGISETLYAIKVKKDIIMPSYLMYALYSETAKKQFEPKISKGSVPHLKIDDLMRVQIPIPSLPAQKEIVDILDSFESLCNDLTSGLPAEIESRQKQYEYYRDKLLDFKEISR